MNIGNRESCKPHFIKQKILTLTSIYILEICKFVRKNQHFFTRTSDHHSRSYNLRNKNRLALPISKLKLHSSGPYVHAIKIYNNLPRHIQNEDNIKTFLKLLKNYLIENSFYNLQEFFTK